MIIDDMEKALLDRTGDNRVKTPWRWRCGKAAILAIGDVHVRNLWAVDESMPIEDRLAVPLPIELFGLPIVEEIADTSFVGWELEPCAA